MTDFDTPDFLLPFTFTSDGSAAEVEQGSDTEIQQCAWAVLSYEPGQLLAQPEMGLPDPTFRKGGVDIEQVQKVLQQWEPRAEELIDRDPNWVTTLVDKLQLRRDNTSDG